MTLKNWPNDARIGDLFITRAMKNFLIIKDRILDDYENELLEVGLFYNVAQYQIVCSYCLVGGLVTCYSLTMVMDQFSWWSHARATKGVGCSPCIFKYPIL